MVVAIHKFSPKWPFVRSECGSVVVVVCNVFKCVVTAQIPCFIRCSVSALIFGLLSCTCLWGCACPVESIVFVTNTSVLGVYVGWSIVFVTCTYLGCCVDRVATLFS